MIGELVRIKVFRESKAEMEVARARSELTVAIQALADAKAALTDYCAWSLNHEREMYAEFCKKLVKPREIEWLREDVLLLRGKERELDAAVATADAQRGRAEEGVRVARGHHADATRNREKFDEVAKGIAADALVEAMRREESELEDLYAIRRDKDEWGDGSDE
jgi:type III secretion protein O